jgi:hypothetical protein
MRPVEQGLPSCTGHELWDSHNQSSASFESRFQERTLPRPQTHERSEVHDQQVPLQRLAVTSDRTPRHVALDFYCQFLIYSEESEKGPSEGLTECNRTPERVSPLTIVSLAQDIYVPDAFIRRQRSLQQTMFRP